MRLLRRKKSLLLPAIELPFPDRQSLSPVTILLALDIRTDSVRSSIWSVFLGCHFSAKPSNNIWNAMGKVDETDDGWRGGGDTRRASGCCASVGSGKQGLKRETMFKGAAQAAQVFPPILILLDLPDMKEQRSCKRLVDRTDIYRKLL